MGTYDAATNKVALYIDGEQVAEAEGVSLSYAEGEFRIARHWTTNYTDGRIAEVAIYNAVLSAAEVKKHYEAGLAPEVTTPSNQTWYEMNPSTCRSPQSGRQNTKRPAFPLASP